MITKFSGVFQKMLYDVEGKDFFMFVRAYTWWAYQNTSKQSLFILNGGHTHTII